MVSKYIESQSTVISNWKGNKVTDPPIKLVDFGITRGGASFFEPFSLTLQAGEIVSITGPNGAGKSTLLSMIAGIHIEGVRHQGECEIMSSQIHSSAYCKVRPMLMFVRQSPTLFKSLTVEEQLLLSTPEPPSLLGAFLTRSNKKRLSLQIIKEALEEVGLIEYLANQVSSLSIGQLRSVSLAAAWIKLKMGLLRILLMDEPASGLDPHRQEYLRRLVKEASERDCAVLIAEHLHDNTSSLSKEIISLVPMKGLSNGSAA